MNIGIFTDTYSPTVNGVITSIDTFAGQMRQRGHLVYVFAPYVTGNEPKEEFIYRYPSMPLVFQPEHRLVLALNLKAAFHIRKLNLDLVHSQTPFVMGKIAEYYAKKLNIPLVHTYHTYFPEYLHYAKGLISEKVLAMISKTTCDESNLVISPSKKIERLLDKYDVTSTVTVLHNGIDTVEVRKCGSEEMPILPGMNPGKRFIVYSGRLGKEKNVDFLLKAMSGILDAHDDVKLVLIGDGPHRRMLENEVERLGIGSSVIFTGYMNRGRLLAVLSRASAFVFPSLSDVHPMVILESLASGVPVVAIRDISVEGMIDDGRTGFMTGHDPDDFAASVVRLLDMDEKSRQTMSRAALDKAEQFDVTRQGIKLLELYERVIDGEFIPGRKTKC